MPPTRDDDPHRVLAQLIRRARQRLGWSAERAATEAKRRGLDNLSARNIRDYETPGKRKRDPTEDVILRFATLFGENKEEWLSNFPGHGLNALLLSRESIFEIQRDLQEGDRVALLSSRAFLEDSDSEVSDLVVRNLKRGVAYTYYFPAPEDSGPYGGAAAEAYRRFRDERVARERFDKTPLLFGFAVNFKRFRYFSNLHTIVRHTSARPVLNQTYCFIELSRGGSGGPEQAWYVVPEEPRKQIFRNLRDARSSVADFGMPLLALNSRLFRVGDEYVQWFRRTNSAAEYSELRQILGHTGDRCLEGLLEEIGHTPRLRDRDKVSYLDIGCGDGALASAVADYLANLAQVAVVGLDASQAQLDVALTEFKRLPNVAFEPVKRTLESFESDRRFNLITAVHSLYVIDEAYTRRIFELLEPGGLACIWLAMRKENVITDVCVACDDVLRPGQRRNTADDVVSFAKAAGLNASIQEFAGAISGLLDGEDLTPDGQKLIDFCALQKVAQGTREWNAGAAALRASLGPDGSHPITDGLIVFQRDA